VWGGLIGFKLQQTEITLVSFVLGISESVFFDQRNLTEGLCTKLLDLALDTPDERSASSSCNWEIMLEGHTTKSCLADNSYLQRKDFRQQF
jgi:hypothetical protein